MKDEVAVARFTYRDLADRLGLSGPDAARMKAKRETAKPGTRWRIIPGNHPQDPVHIEVPLEELPETPPERPSPPSPPTPGDEDGTAASVAAIGEILAGELRDAIGRAEGLHTQLLAETKAHGETTAQLVSYMASTRTAAARHRLTRLKLRQALERIAELEGGERLEIRGARLEIEPRSGE